MPRVRKAQLSLGSAASNDSGFGSGGLDQQARHLVCRKSNIPTIPGTWSVGKRIFQQVHRKLSVQKI